ESFRWVLTGGLLRRIGSSPVRRAAGERRAIITCLKVLRAGTPLGFFREWTRSRPGSLGRAREGIAFLARRSGAPILPVAVIGTPEARPFRSHIRVRVGEPFLLDDLALAASGSEQEVADAIMGRVSQLLQPRMRGYYTDV